MVSVFRPDGSCRTHAGLLRCTCLPGYDPTVSENKAINVSVPIATARRLRREAFEAEVSQGSIVATALDVLWSLPVPEIERLVASLHPADR